MHCGTPAQGHTAQQEGQATDTARGCLSGVLRHVHPCGPSHKLPTLRRPGSAVSPTRDPKGGLDCSASCTATRQKLQPGCCCTRERRSVLHGGRGGPTQLAVLFAWGQLGKTLSRDVTQCDVRLLAGAEAVPAAGTRLEPDAGSPPAPTTSHPPASEPRFPTPPGTVARTLPPTSYPPPSCDLTARG